MQGREGVARDVPWGDLDGATLAWYVGLLRERLKLAGGTPAEIVREHLLDGRGEVPEGDLRQIRLLFGRERDVRRELGRAVIDLRARASEAERGAREELFGNVISALRAAVEFVAAHSEAVEGLTAEGLREENGTADYLAVREALVNALVHQDYTERGMAAQVDILPYQTSFINPGYALIDEDELLDGGNVSRNPVISRALKLIGFAELMGSGLRILDSAWRGAGRPKPSFRSNRDANRFRLTLDSRALESGTDEFWRARLGVEVSPEEGDLLRSLADVEGGLTREALAERAGRRCGRHRADGPPLPHRRVGYRSRWADRPGADVRRARSRRQGDRR